jgi:TolA-binding protein
MTTGPDGELAAYRIAHTAHFRGNDPKAALAAWDAYLAKFPDGRMALDARYDRALVLVKLERWSEARAALAPFAAANSTYRRVEAQKILDAIRAR